MPITKKILEYESHPHENIVLHKHSNISWVAYGYSATLLHALRSNIPCPIRHFATKNVDIEVMIIDAMSVKELLEHTPALENTSERLVLSSTKR